MAREDGDFWNETDDNTEKKRKDSTEVDTSSEDTDETPDADMEDMDTDD
jgi:hypothetical protein